MRALLVVAVVVACKGKHDDAPTPAPTKRDAAVVAIDWAKCEKTLDGIVATPVVGAALATLLDGCRVCGDWTPILAWQKRPDDGGPSRQAIVDAMDRCNAFCDSTAKTYFMGTLDDARGRTSNKPWIELGKECKDKVSAVPDTRYMSATFFALDRIARTAAAHGGAIAKRVAELDVPLPALSLTGVGVALPAPDGGTIHGNGVDVDDVVTILGDRFFFGHRPRARMTATGLAVTLGDPPYPGAAIDLKSKAIGDLTLVIAPKQAPAAKVLDVVVAASRTKGRIVLAIDGSTKNLAWSVPVGAGITLVAGDDIEIDDKMTVDELATAIFTHHPKHEIGLRRKKP